VLVLGTGTTRTAEWFELTDEVRFEPTADLGPEGVVVRRAH
jgi:hypothetical protein